MAFGSEGVDRVADGSGFSDDSYKNVSSSHKSHVKIWHDMAGFPRMRGCSQIRCGRPLTGHYLRRNEA
jgi:hypothetical protein